MLSNRINYRSLVGRAGITFSDWLTLDQAITQAPKSIGVYVMRGKDGRKFYRVKGESDIVYIGSSKNLKNRLRQYKYTNQKASSPTKRVKWFSGIYPIEIAFAITSSPATLFETMLLQTYIGDHHELPPLNNSNVLKHLLTQ